ITDGSSNTIIISESTPVPPVPTRSITDGSSNPSNFVQSTPTATPGVVVSQPTVGVPPATNPSLPGAISVSLSSQRPLPLGQGGVRIVLLNQSRGLVQCGVGLVNCAIIQRTPGKGLR
ncbi:MAG: hypothetical protein K8I30_02950, partial [Anaerolineae bacterium]|nr:hypothetical protein [Anaerolineae bacterium]